LLILTPEEWAFLEVFQKSEYKPELLFGGETLERVRNHPMALWRTTSARDKAAISQKPSLHSQ
jgi:hypothetical protein